MNRNFLDFERESLVNLVEKYRDIVENKKTDSDMIEQKKQIWFDLCIVLIYMYILTKFVLREQITHEYNKNPNVKKRLTKQLRKLWENTKAKRKIKLKSSSTTSLLSTTMDKWDISFAKL